MPSKKKKYNARFPAGRIKKIMQTDEEVGKVAQAVPVIISRTLELFVESLLSKTMQITMAKSAKTLSTSHMKQCILSESRFDFLKDLVKSLPDSSTCDDDNVSVSSAGLSPGAATPTMGITGPPTSMLSSDLVTTSPTLPLQTPFPPHCSLPSREPSIDSDNLTRLYPAATSVAGACQQNSSSAGAILPPRMNPNFYTESPSLRINHNRGNHFSNNPSAAVSNERPSSPPLLVVDEDYDT